MAELAARGHDVTVLTGYPNYPGGTCFRSSSGSPRAFMRYEGAEVVRVPLWPEAGGASSRAQLSELCDQRRRHRQLATCAAASSMRSSSYEPSPITVGIPAVVLRALKRAPVAFWVLDLWPETLQARRPSLDDGA